MYEILYLHVCKIDELIFRYIRLSDDTPQKLVFRLLKKKWKVNNPGMVVSTIGSLDNFTIKREVKSLIKHGIIKAVSLRAHSINTKLLN